MGFYIRRGAEDTGLWLKRVAPYVTWGPREQAQEFSSRTEALAASRRAARGIAETLAIVAEPALPSDRVKS